MIGEDERIKLQVQFTELLLSVERQGVHELLNFLERSDFFVAPASTKWHGSYRGGLLEHSMNVYKVFVSLCKLYTVKIPRDTIILCSLLHDLCKIHLYHGSDLNGIYAWDPVIIKEGHAVRSLRLIAQSVKLSDQEKNIIYYHMGLYEACSVYERAYTVGEFNLATKEDPLILLFHHADDQANKFLDGDRP